jgi:hypothetical protein
LQSIIDYERFNPAVPAAFDGSLCGLGCNDLDRAECSCTCMSPYWSSTTFGGRPTEAFVVTFNLGLIETRLKSEPARLRAVRNASAAGSKVPK